MGSDIPVLSSIKSSLENPTKKDIRNQLNKTFIDIGENPFERSDNDRSCNAGKSILTKV